MQAWGPDEMSRLRATLKALAAERQPEWSWEDLTAYLRWYKRLKESTIEVVLGQLRFMAEHPKMPLALHGNREDLVTSFCLLVAYREQFEKDQTGPSGLQLHHYAVRRLGDFLGIPGNIWPKAPTVPAKQEKELPPPERVREILSTDFWPNAKRSYENALTRYLLAFDFGFGPRAPSEMFAAREFDWNPDRHTMVMREPKKSGRRRTVLIEPRFLCCSKRHASMEMWMRHRDRLGPDTDALFPAPGGGEFDSKVKLRSFLVDRVQPRFPWWTPYLGRHWSVNARLIEWDFNYNRVAKFHGHKSADTTRNEYEHSAEIHRSLFGDQWLIRAFQRPPRTARTPKTREPVHPSPVVHARKRDL